jgi:hypothetical protein
MKRPTGSPRLYLASSGSDQTLVARSEQKLRSTLATLEECRAVLSANASGETAHLVSVAILQLRMKLNRVADSELRALCDAMTPDPRLMEASPPSSQGRARRSQTVLKLVE